MDSKPNPIRSTIQVATTTLLRTSRLAMFNYTMRLRQIGILAGGGYCMHPISSVKVAGPTGARILMPPRFNKTLLKFVIPAYVPLLF